jgi:hypothetical protein
LRCSPSSRALQRRDLEHVALERPPLDAVAHQLAGDPRRRRAAAPLRALLIGRGEEHAHRSQCPNSRARWEHAASMTTRTSSIRCSSVGSCSIRTRSEGRTSRLSKLITRRTTGGVNRTR